MNGVGGEMGAVGGGRSLSGGDLSCWACFEDKAEASYQNQEERENQRFRGEDNGFRNSNLPANRRRRGNLVSGRDFGNLECPSCTYSGREWAQAS